MKKTYKNTLPKNMEVKSTNVRIENGEVFVDVEFKEKFQPKDGDFLATKDGRVFIYNGSNTDIQYGAYCGIDIYNEIIVLNYFSSSWTGKEGCRFATPEEKADFLERLEKECGKKWSAEKKCLEDIYVPKFGDIVRVDLLDTDSDCEKSKYMVSIYPNKKFVESSYFFDIATLTRGNDIIYTAGSYIKSITKASKSEKQELFDKLAEVGKRWNPETKKLEDIRWRANLGEKYWYIADTSVLEDNELAANDDDVRYKNKNYFRTSEAAQKVADQIKEIFKNSKAE